MVKRYCMVEYKEEVLELVQASRDWPDFKAKLLDKYQLGDQLLDLADVRKEDREKEGVSADKDQAVYKTLTDMRNMMADMKEERLRLQVMMVQTKGGKRKGKAPVVEEVISSSSEEEDGHGIRFCQTVIKDENDKVIYTNIRGEVYDFEGNLIDPNVEGGMRKEAFRRMGRDLPATFRLASLEEVEQIELEAAIKSLAIEEDKSADESLSKEQEEILHRAQLVVRKTTRCRETFVQICADMDEEWPGFPQVFLFGGWDRDGQGGLTNVTVSQPGSPSAGRLMTTTVLSRPAFKRPPTTGLPQARRARRPPRSRATPEEGPSQPRKTETVSIEEDDGEEDELLRAEDERQAKQRAMEREPEMDKVDVGEGEPKKKKQVYTVPVEQGLDIEQIVERILESQRDLFTLKEFFASSPKIREAFRHRLSRKKVMTVKMGDIFP
ncbi:hypothetical protein CBR_g5732 [Chara braunii]|uniref:Uncharacterized protein n=1 Tax=Chara braunii TaxID=69332 RepID=A0A388KJ68_CHABU|nr:hypothetical protein CBR_g5732 [Chara braunii]|eukprot:GBG70101.1 hypothetical protein CBR_g5732 [Chara braunii]